MQLLLLPLLLIFTPVLSLPVLPLPVPVPDDLITTFTTFTTYSFPHELFTCTTTRSSPLISAVTALPSKVHCVPAGTTAKDLVGGGLISVGGKAEEGEDTCFLLESVVAQVVARCGWDGRVGGRLRLPVGEVEVGVGVGL